MSLGININPEEITQDDLQDILAMCYNDSKFMAQLMFKDAFYAPMSSLHDKFFDFIDNCKAKKKVIVAPRGFGKTTIMQLIVKKRILFRDRRFIGYLSKSTTSAQIATSDIRMDLQVNPMVKAIFGDVRQSKVEGVEEKWAETSWIANGMTLVLPRGAGQQVRGLKWNNARPDLWVIDDLEDDELVQNPNQRLKLKEWFEGALMYTVSQYEGYQDYEIIYVDTIKHEDALITYLIEDPEWEYLNIPVCDENYKTLDPTFISQERLDAELEKHRRNRTMHIFARERLGQPTSKEAASFKAEYFRYYSEEDDDFVHNIRPRLVNVVIWDPARAKDPKNAQTAFVVWGLDFEKQTYYIRYAKGDYLSVSEQYDRAIDLSLFYNVQVLAIETAGLEEHILYPFKNECLRRGIPALAGKIFEVNPRTGKGELVGEEGGKDGRIRALLPFYEKGLIKHNKDNIGAYEQQLLSFPRSKLKDMIDAAAYLVQVLESGVRYMHPQYSPEELLKIQDSNVQMVANIAAVNRKVFI